MKTQKANYVSENGVEHRFAKSPPARSPLPYATSDREDRTLIVSGGPILTGEIIGVCEKRANAEYLKDTANLLPEMVELIKVALEKGDMPIEWDREADEILSRAKEALGERE